VQRELRRARPSIGEEHLLVEPDVTIAFYTHGKGDTVVLLASAGRSVSDFNELVLALSDKGFRTVAVESRGVGKSTLPDSEFTLHDLARDVKKVLDQVGGVNGGRVHLVGHAFGNRVVRAFASDYPEFSQSVTLIAAGGLVAMFEEAKEALHYSFFLALREEVRREHIRYAFFAPSSRIPDYWIIGWFPKAAGPQGATKKNTPLEEWWWGGSVPILILQGEDDTVAPPGNADAMKKEFPDRVTVVMVPDAGHAMLPEQPDIIENALLSFLSKIQVEGVK